MLPIHFNKTTLCRIVLVFCTIYFLASCNTQHQNIKPVKRTYSSKPRPIDFWHMFLGTQLKSNWKPSETLQSIDQNLETIILINVSSDGSLKNAAFDKRSWNSELDNYAMLVVKKSFPLAPLPKDMNSHKIGVIFTAKGLK